MSLDKNDDVQCYMCGLCLRNWEHLDNVFEEHGKFSPQCPFVIRWKGQRFVKNLMRMHPGLKRPETKFSDPVVEVDWVTRG